jgi:hypothetical protein
VGRTGRQRERDLEARTHPRVVGRDQQGRTDLGRALGEQIQRLLRIRVVEVRGRFVREDQRRSIEQGPGERDPECRWSCCIQSN